MAANKVTGWVSYRDLEAETGASPTTLRRFVERFPMFMAGRMVDRRQMFPGDTVELVRRIQGLYAAGKNTSDILGILAVERAATLDVTPAAAAAEIQPSEAIATALAPMAERFVSALELLARNQGETLELLRQLVQGEKQPTAARKMERVEIEARIQALAAEGLGERAIQTRLVREGVPTVSGRGSWSTSSIRRILKAKRQEGGHDE